nr:MAG TPA: DNA helicase [Siphoviridae sp. ctYuc6]
MVIRVANVITVENPTKEMKEWCKEYLEIDNPEYSQRARMGFWLGNTPKTLSLYEVRSTDWILPFGVFRRIPIDFLLESEVIDDFNKDPAVVDFNATVPLYDYQETAVESMVLSRSGILQSAAGSGKTQMGLALATMIGRRTLWLCHTLDLVKQSRERAKLYMSEELMGTITEGRVNLGSGITFATVQTMSNLDLTQYRDYWDCVIVDEVHRVSGSPTAVTRYQKVLNSLSARHKYGLSATLHRADGMIKATFSLIGDLEYVVPLSAVSNKIMKVGIYPVGTGTQMSREALNTDGTLNYAKLITYLTENRERNQTIVDCIEQKPSLILSDRLAHLETLMNMLPADMRKDAVMISGKMTSKKGKQEREQALEDMRSGKKKYLFATYSLAKEGLDVPRLERLYLTTPQKDFTVITQSVGRIARTHEGKAEPIAYDFVDRIVYLEKLYKKRCTVYRKNECYFVEDKQ